MVFLQRFFADLFMNLTPARGISILIDVALTSLLFYDILRLISNTRALQLAQGLLMFYLLVFGVEWLSLKTGLLHSTACSAGCAASRHPSFLAACMVFHRTANECSSTRNSKA